VGTVVQPLQSVNCHDSHAHGHEQHACFILLVGFGWVGPTGFESSRSVSGYAASAKPVCMVWLQVGCLCALVDFGYRCDSCELEALDYRGESTSVVMLRYCLGLGAFSANKPFG
jgi:hypothetical protein